MIGKIIHTLKYDVAEDILGSIETIVDRFVSAYTQYIPSVDMILPVPLHKKRFAERGFNQAFLIARILATHTDIPLFSRILIRKRDTPHQAQLDREGRLKNVVDAFSISAPEAIRGKRILLVDDVYTTGATMQTCAEVILSAGASSVSGWTL
ncbi:MAG: phosphoribosyltransferase, partial [uncultured bacterium]